MNNWFCSLCREHKDRKDFYTVGGPCKDFRTKTRQQIYKHKRNKYLGK